jgi:acetyl esterase
VADAQRSNPLASPAEARTLTGYPPAVVSTSGFDRLHDEGRDYARCLIESEVPTSYLPFPAFTHGWMDMTTRVPAAAEARTLVFDAFRTLLSAARIRPSITEALA